MAIYMEGFQHFRFYPGEIKSDIEYFGDKNIIRNHGFGTVYKGEICFLKSIGAPLNDHIVLSSLNMQGVTLLAPTTAMPAMRPA